MGTAFIGFGEAAQAFAGAGGWRGRPNAAFDIRVGEPVLADAAGACGVVLAAALADALAGADVVFSLVTAGQALAAARAAAPGLQPGGLYVDGNSVAPQTKRLAAAAIEGAGACYVDAAIMAPVLPTRLGVPLLVSGPHAEAAADTLTALGFTRCAVLAGPVGHASAVKMVRSVLVKGLEALTAECALAAEAAGVRDAVFASLDASWAERPWAERADYHLERMLTHGARRAEEMAEVAATLDALGVGAGMTRAAADWQRALGGRPAPEGLEAKLSALRVPGTAAA
jgi:3-hydroxyisobutyrate dehydrogenase-like beta-hydroxyacid dehydrogenase